MILLEELGPKARVFWAVDLGVEVEPAGRPRRVDGISEGGFEDRWP